MLSWPLEDWLTDEGDRVVQLKASGKSLSDADLLLYHVWLLDTESRNGGLSQYFCNRELAAWNACLACTSKANLRSFRPFRAEVEALINTTEDPYEAIMEAGESADELWDKHSEAVVRELHEHLKHVS